MTGWPGPAVEPLTPAADGVVLDRAGAGPPRVMARADHPDPAEACALARVDLDNGADGLVITLAGAATARGFGLNLGSGERLAAWLDGLGGAGVACRLEAPPFAGTDLRAGLARWAAGRAIAATVSLGLDPIGEVARTGVAPLPWSGGVGPTLADALGAEVDALRGHPGPVLLADGRPHHEAGATVAEELAAVVATVLAYWRALEAVGLDLAETRDRVEVMLAVDTDVMLSLSKLRALRRLLNAVEAACGLDPGFTRLHAETAWRCQSRLGAATNLPRGTAAAAAAILGGADSLTVLPHTQALGLPDAFARRLARNTALVLIEEAGLGRVTDPGAGSGAIEALTDALCRDAWSILNETEAAGGLPAMLASGGWAARIAASRERRQEALAAGRSVLVGTTHYLSDGDDAPVVLRPAPAAATEAAFPALPSRRDAEPFEGAGA